MLPWAPLLTLGLLLLPVAAGLAGVLLPAFGWRPSLGGTAPSLDAWHALADWPGLPRAARLSVTTGLAATAISFGLTILICAAWQGTRAFAAIERALSPLLSVPHAAAALGLAFLIAPSGWVVRALSPWATGWDRPPDILVAHDPLGLALVAGLVVKEVPFLMLMTLAALGQVPARRSLLLAQTLGYGRIAGWIATVLPRIYPQIRLPIYAVLAYSASVVDVAIVLGPTTPAPLAVQVLAWLGDPDLAMRFQASAAALLQLGLVVACLLLWCGGEALARPAGAVWLARGRRGARDGAARGAALLAATLVVAAVLAGLAGLAVWSVAGFWGFPDALPDGFSLRTWRGQAGALGAVAGRTAWIGAAATLVAILMALACLEAEHRHAVVPGRNALWLLYVPLLVPQATFLTGLQTLAIGAGLAGATASVIATHVVFVLPYVFLSLSGPFRAWDTRLGLVAETLGAGPDRVLWRVRLPMLLAPVATAAAVGFAVSVGQYLPTLLIGTGRVTTLATEAVALSSGGDRRLIGVYAVAQTLMPLAAFALALGLPRLVYRDRRAMTGRA